MKFFRWAADRLILQKTDGIVCFVSNNSFVDQIAFDGMRKHLMRDFTRIDHIDLHGNVRRNPILSGTTHNVFGIQVGVGITVAVIHKGADKRLRYHRVPEFWNKHEKYNWLSQSLSPSIVSWKTLAPDAANTWNALETQGGFDDLCAIGFIFKEHSRGLESARDNWVYGQNRKQILKRMHQFAETYNAEVDRWKRAPKQSNLDDFVLDDSKKIKWSSALKQDLALGRHARPIEDVRPILYRPFSKYLCYADPIFIHRPGISFIAFPKNDSENTVLSITAHSQTQFSLLVADLITEHATGGRAGNVFPFYTYPPMASPGAKTSPTRRSLNSATVTKSPPSRSGTSSTTSTPSSTTPAIVKSTPTTSSANCLASPSHRTSRLSRPPDSNWLTCISITSPSLSIRFASSGPRTARITDSK